MLISGTPFCLYSLKTYRLNDCKYIFCEKSCIYKFIEDNLTIYFMHIFGTLQSHSYFLSLITRSKFILVNGHFYSPFFIIYLITKLKEQLLSLLLLLLLLFTWVYIFNKRNYLRLKINETIIPFNFALLFVGF